MRSESEDQASAERPQDEVVSSTLRRRLQECFAQATKLASQEKYDHDYAHTLLIQCVVNDPGNLTYVEAFLENLQRKYDNNRKGARIKGFGGRGQFKKAVAKKQWSDVLKLGPEILKTNPWDVPTLRAMAQGCEAYSYNDVELRYLKNAWDANPKDADVNRHCGRSLARMGQFDQAVACWHRVEEIDPNDKEATRMVSLLTTEKARIAAGMVPEIPVGKMQPKRKEGAQRPQQELAEEDGALQPKRQIPLTRRQRLEQAIAEEPTNVNKYLELTELLRSEDRLAEAERVLNKALNVSGNDLKIREQLEDVQIERAKQQLAIAERQATEEPTDEASELAKRLRKELNRRAIEVLSCRVERYPTDNRLKLDLAIHLKRDGNYPTAVNYLLQAREAKELKAEATLEMGECFQHQKLFAKALQCYARAAEVASNDSDCRKLALYRAGVLAAGIKELDKAQHYLAELAKIDADYKDLQARLDKIQRIRDKSGSS